VKLMEAGVVGPPGVTKPNPSPEVQRLFFDLVELSADPAAANGSPLVYQWNFSDTDPWHLTVANGSSKAEPGLAPNPTVTFDTTWQDWIAFGKPDANPLKFVLQRKVRPHGSPRELARLRKVFA
jgi:alkyl sulfatase BDS1-like metallo-beta-lactamase superfamily hydrolase